MGRGAISWGGCDLVGRGRYLLPLACPRQRAEGGVERHCILSRRRVATAHVLRRVANEKGADAERTGADLSEEGERKRAHGWDVYRRGSVPALLRRLA